MIEPLPLARSDVSPDARAFLLAFLPPFDVSTDLIVQVPACCGDAVSQGQGHARVVGPLPGLQAMRPAVSVAGHWSEAAWRFELDSGSECIADRQANQGSPATVVHDVPSIAGRSECVTPSCGS
jgi:hypothetical protein